jgi:CHAT domain-containing protein
MFVGFADPAVAAVSPAPPTRSASLSPEQELPRLPGTRDEVRAIADLYPREQVALYIGDLATEENVKSNPLLESVPRIHFATHGLFYEDHPERSALVLTPPGPGSHEDGYLRVDEIFNLKLGANLLVLSACETGRGKEVRGEGLVGLTRAFLYAGARSLVVSLWPVQDTTTPELMVGFYSHLAPGHSKAEALRQTKLKRIAEGRAHPYYWAPFILAGDPH